MSGRFSGKVSGGAGGATSNMLSVGAGWTASKRVQVKEAAARMISAIKATPPNPKRREPRLIGWSA